MPAGPHTKKFSIVSIHHGWMQKHDFSVLDQKYPIWQHLVQKSKIKILTFSWNLMPMLIRVWRSQGDVHFSVFDQKYPLWVNLVKKKKKKINSLSWNLLDYCNLSMQNSVVMFTFSVLIQNYFVCRIWRIHLCCLLFLTGHTFLGQIWWKKSKLSV